MASRGCVFGGGTGRVVKATANRVTIVKAGRHQQELSRRVPEALGVFRAEQSTAMAMQEARDEAQWMRV